MPRQTTDTSMGVAEIWGVRPGLRVWVGGHAADAKGEIEKHLAGTERPPTGPIDLGLIAPNTDDEALYFAGKLRPRMAPGSSLWIVYPTPRSARGADFAAMFDEMVVGMFERGFQEVGRSGLTDQFSTIGFRAEGARDDF